MFLPWFVWRGFLNLTLDRGCSKMPFRKADSLVSFGRMTDSCKKNEVSKISRFVWTGPKRRFVVSADHKMTSY